MDSNSHPNPVAMCGCIGLGHSAQGKHTISLLPPDCSLTSLSRSTLQKLLSPHRSHISL